MISTLDPCGFGTTAGVVLFTGADGLVVAGFDGVGAGLVAAGFVAAGAVLFVGTGAGAAANGKALGT